MHERVILISDDNDFFEYLIPKLMLRESDKILTLNFDNLLENIHLIQNSLLIVNSENNKNKTLELLNIAAESPTIVFGYNNDEQFKIDAYKSGMFAYFTLSASQDEINALILPAFKVISSQTKTKIYRDLLIKNDLLMKNNEVFLDYDKVLAKQIEIIKDSSSSAVLMAISPNDKSKFLIHSNQIETVVLSSIRKNDILMNYAPNKYFLLLNNTSIKDAKVLWDKINKKLPQGIFAGFTSIVNKNSESAVNDAINMLQKAINNSTEDDVNVSELSEDNINFKSKKKDFTKRLEQVIYPAFYKFQLLWGDKLFGAKIKQKNKKNSWGVEITSNNLTGLFIITNPGYFAVNIDISFSGLEHSEPKRITLEQEELEERIISDLLEQFVMEFKDLNDEGIDNDYS